MTVKLALVGQVRSVSVLATNTVYKIDDGTGIVEVKQWTDSDAEPDSKRPPPVEDQYVKVWGRIKAFNDKRHVGARVIRVITDYNEINLHLLEATAVHLYFTKGPPEGVKTDAGGDNMFVGGYGGTANGGAVMHGTRKLPPNMSIPAKRMFDFLLSAPQNNEGLHVSHIAQGLGISTQNVFRASDELLADGVVYTTVDDETWAVLEY